MASGFAVHAIRGTMLAPAKETALGATEAQL
jgi:hypothetical protein